MLELWTARISTRDPDAFNVTRKSGDPAFAPSWQTLVRMLDIRKEGRAASDEEWAWYVSRYRTEMRKSFESKPEAWKALLGRPRAVLTCYCVNPERCHRVLLARILVRMGADYRGELCPEDTQERELFEIATELE